MHKARRSDKRQKCKNRCNRAGKKANRCYKQCKSSGDRGERGDGKGTKSTNEPCKADNECFQGTCAHVSYDGSSFKVCCAEGKALFDTKGVKYCSNQKAGERCFANAMCTCNKCNVDGLHKRLTA